MDFIDSPLSLSPVFPFSDTKSPDMDSLYNNSIPPSTFFNDAYDDVFPASAGTATFPRTPHNQDQVPGFYSSTGHSSSLHTLGSSRTDQDLGTLLRNATEIAPLKANPFRAQKEQYISPAHRKCIYSISSSIPRLSREMLVHSKISLPD